MKKAKLVPALVFCCLTMLATSALAGGRCCDGDNDGRSRGGRDRIHEGNFSGDSHATGNMDVYSGDENRENNGNGGGDRDRDGSCCD